MKKTRKPDFSGYASKNDLDCSDGRIIRKGAFSKSNGKKVPLVWNHVHDSPNNILGHALLEERADGMYAYCFLNDTPSGQNAKEFVKNQDIDSLSIYANRLMHDGRQVIDGIIREVSMVVSGANPGAKIDFLSIVHGDGSEQVDDTEAIVTIGVAVDYPSDDSLEHKEEAEMKNESEMTVQEIFDTFTDTQKQVVYALIAQAVSDSEEEMKQSSLEENNYMKHNVFDNVGNREYRKHLTEEEMAVIFADAVKAGSLRDSVLYHADEYGIENIDYLFPDAKTLTNSPSYIKRDTGWVGKVLNAAYKTPFSRIKTVHADITADAARALGYVKGAMKKDEVIRLLKRSTTPTTVYKKQKLDRDDILDIKDLDVVAWVKAEMRVMLDEEIARACLIGDGRDPASPDKINEENIRPIWKDEDMYTHKVKMAADTDTDAFIDAIVKCRADYKGSGNPTLYTTTSIVSDMMLLKDSIGRRIYGTMDELTAALRVKEIVEVPVMDNMTRTDEDDTVVLKGILVNLVDYSFGADKGGEVSMFEDFDIDFNQQKFLLEARLSGALTQPKGAVVFEQIVEEE